MWKFILVFEKWYFSFDRSNMQIFTVNITRVVWPHVTNFLELRYFCRHITLFYHLNLIPCHYWSWQRNVYFLVNIFVRHTFSMSKNSIKTKTVLTNDRHDRIYWASSFSKTKGWLYVTLKICLCICAVLSWDELKVQQNLLASDCEIHMVCLLVATVYWHKSLQFVKKSNMTLLPCSLVLYHILARFNLQFVNLLHIIILVAWQAWHI